jgi:transposase
MQMYRRLEIDPKELDALVGRVKSGAMREGDEQTVEAMAETIKVLHEAVEKKSSSIKRLLQMLFGSSTEKSRRVLKKPKKPPAGDAAPASTSADEGKPKGHGRRGAAGYTGAERIPVAHETLSPGARCPQCPNGKVYRLKRSSPVLCIRGSAPLQAVHYELEQLRCNLCGTVFTAAPPQGCSTSKYDETVGSMIALLKYGSGFPFNRLEKLQQGFGVPVPSSTQWQIIDRKAEMIRSAYQELLRQGAQGTVIHNDDTGAKILEFMSDTYEPPDPSRTGTFTTGILSRLGEHTVALYCTGNQHAGENLADVLASRDAGREPPIQMCDALSRNLPGPFQVVLAHCMVHARRNFVDIADLFPAECRIVLETLEKVYHHDAISKRERMSDEQRLAFHAERSAPLMTELHASLTQMTKEKTVEPNSALGGAIAYMLKHWKPLTRFLEVPGAPLDNNLCEQVLKRAIMHRKNSLFFKTQRGADVGDLYMSLIHTCTLNAADPFDYLTQLEKHHAELRANPERWMPWNYRENHGNGR